MAVTLLAAAGSERTRDQGFTLVELLVTLGILAAIATLGTSLTRSWVDDAHANEAAAQLLQAYAKTRALALRNASGKPLDTAAAVMCISNGEVHSQNLPESGTLTCGSNSVWHAVIAGQSNTRITIGHGSQTGGTTFSCIALNNRGIPTAYTTCTTEQKVTISTGSSHVIQKTLGGT